MIHYKDVLKKVLFIFSISLFIIALVHIICTLTTKNFYYYNMIVIITLCFISLLIVIMIITYFILCLNKTNKIYNILYDEVNVSKAIDNTIENLDNVITNRNKVTLNLFLINCYYNIGNIKDAFMLLEKNEVFKLNIPVSYKIVWYHNFIMIAANSYEDELVKQFTEYLEKLKKIYPRKANVINSYLFIEKKFISFKNREYTDVEKYYIESLESAVSKFDKVLYNYILTVIKKGLNQDFNKNKEFVTRNGNDLTYVKEVEVII